MADQVADQVTNAAILELIGALDTAGTRAVHVLLDHLYSDLDGDLAYEVAMQSLQDCVTSAITAHGVKITQCSADGCATPATVQHIAIAYTPENGVERDAHCATASSCVTHDTWAHEEGNFLLARAYRMFFEANNADPVALYSVTIVLNDTYLRFITHVIEKAGKLPKAD